MVATSETTARSILSETRRSLSAAARKFPGHRGGEHVNTATVFRWVTKGVKTPAGVIRLEAVRAGVRWITSDEAVERFVDRLTAASTADASQAQDATRSPAARNRSSAQAAAELDALGVC